MYIANILIHRGVGCYVDNVYMCQSCVFLCRRLMCNDIMCITKMSFRFALTRRVGNWWKITARNRTTGNRFRLWLIIAIHNSPDARNNRHKPNQTVSGAIIITNGL